MNSENIKSVTELSVKIYPKKQNNFINYGTAGFRTHAEDLHHVLFRMGVLAVLRSKAKNSAAIGVMITASHNAESDNGIKIVDPYGEMLEQRWEKIATRLANCDDVLIQETLDDIINTEKINFRKYGTVFIGQDTRPSSRELASAAIAGVRALGGALSYCGVVTTPMLHYFVACHNTKGEYGQVSVEGYFTKLSENFKLLRKKLPVRGNYKPVIDFDGANSVAALKMKELQPFLGDSLAVTVYNDDTVTRGKLNNNCGADYVKVHQQTPVGVPVAANRRCVSVDGDGDRIVYFYTDSDGGFHLLDGDRIATLVAGYLKELIQASGLELEVGMVQTAYANGASTKYVMDTLRVPVACVPSGVKHLHHKALEYDIGVYFEANGHGTVIFSETAKMKIRQAVSDDVNSISTGKLACLIDVINETVGDALSDMLLVETILAARGWDCVDWEATYTDLPNRLLQVFIQDRTIIQTEDAERKCVSPAGLQDAINKLQGQFPSGRAFVRPSGTENLVRVYAEADTRINADSLAIKVAHSVHRLAGGTGAPPDFNLSSTP